MSVALGEASSGEGTSVAGVVTAATSNADKAAQVFLPTIPSQYFWEKLTNFSPNVLILDVEMPEIDGIELCQVVRNDPHWHLLPVIFIMNDLAADMVEQIFAVGGDDYISKSTVDSKLLACVFNRIERIKQIRLSSTYLER